jgi:hypothetical protein
MNYPLFWIFVGAAAGIVTGFLAGWDQGRISGRAETLRTFAGAASWAQQQKQQGAQR